MVNFVHRIFIGLPLISFLNSTFLYYSSLTKTNLFEMVFNNSPELYYFLSISLINTVDIKNIWDWTSNSLFSFVPLSVDVKDFEISADPKTTSRPGYAVCFAVLSFRYQFQSNDQYMLVTLIYLGMYYKYMIYAHHILLYLPCCYWQLKTRLLHRDFCKKNRWFWNLCMKKEKQHCLYYSSFSLDLTGNSLCWVGVEWWFLLYWLK
jgi:hypothetical protein